MGGSWTTIFIGSLWAFCLHGGVKSCVKPVSASTHTQVEQILAAPYPGSSNSAQPPGALNVLNSIVCEGQKAFVSCQNIFDQIEIVETMYGRKDTSICVHPSIPSNTVCQEQEVQINHRIKGLCEEENVCEVAASNDFMARAGTTICPDVYKYLDIKYRCIPRTFYPNVDSGSENSQSVNEVLTTNGAGGLGASSVISTSSSSSTSSSVPELTVQEHVKTEPVTTATSQASVTPISSHNESGGDITEELSQAERTPEVITETFPGNSAEVNETFRKSDTPRRPEESGEEQSEEESGSGEWDGLDDQRDIVYDIDRR